MHKNVTFPIGNVALIDKIDFETGFFKTVFEPVMGKARTFIPSVKPTFGSYFFRNNIFQSPLQTCRKS